MKEDKHDLLSILIKEINIYEDKQPNGQWLKQSMMILSIILFVAFVATFHLERDMKELRNGK